jgi:hypothetical protein
MQIQLFPLLGAPPPQITKFLRISVSTSHTHVQKERRRYSTHIIQAERRQKILIFRAFYLQSAVFFCLNLIRKLETNQTRKYC